MMENKYYTVLSIAGSDSIGGAGIQADIKTCSALGVYAMSAITAVTAQNTRGVIAYEPVSTEFMRRQLEAVFDDVVPDAVKIGMLPTSEIAEVVADCLEKYKPGNIVTDPVMVATSGDSLAGSGVKEMLISRIFPLSTVVTPNVPEGKALTGINFDSMMEAGTVAIELSRLTGCRNVLLKGGHLPKNSQIKHWLYESSTDQLKSYDCKYIETCNTHGTGCTLSSAIASFLARGENMEDSIRHSLQWINEAIDAGADMKFGNGHGPVNHIFNEMKQWKLKSMMKYVK